ncbi:LysE family translocator [Streptomyces netropsis]|uniref:Threonine/homoserine/homoserine lactone efflux protein n=1 Tax=Streptomyces netropsis TaxID=55404 RepID=A0A7W7PEX1_STRNE|nr:LysE family translocator [Streptomyces netropsis]MBB4887117.1 threonine/homoserine/homoserine lactone efflux protein [Streptomyces netropsis]GGR25485.1 lysine transporter LysE [Streptomyces netropsis]
MTTQLMGFIAASLAIIVVPGPDLVLLLRNAATAGRRGAGATAAGIMLGNAVLAAAAVAGLTALLTSSQMLYTTIRAAGAVYLAYLGVRALIDFFRHHRQHSDAPTPAAQPTLASADHQNRPTAKAFRQGLVSNLLNPKVAAFYLSLFPQFALPGMPALTQHIVLAGLFWALALLWYAVVVTVLGRIQTLLRRRRVERGITGVSGVVLVSLGAALAFRD